MAACFVFFLSDITIAQDQGDPFILKRGFVYLARNHLSESYTSTTNVRYIDYYMRDAIQEKSAQMLAVSMPNPKFGGQFALSTFGLDCKNGAMKLLEMHILDASWNIQDHLKNLRNEHWERPLPNTVFSTILAAGCK